MRETRKLIDLYRLLYEEIKNYDRVTSLCSIIRTLSRNDREYSKWIFHFAHQKPRKILFGLFSINSKFLTDPEFTGGLYWWETTTTGSSLRKLFILHLIKKLS